MLYGTAWKEDRTKSLVTLALSAGFRSFDTANQRRHYFEAAVGEALNEGIDSGLVTRADLFIQTKWTHRRGHDHRLPYDEHAPFADQVQQSFKSSLEHLRTDSVDAYLLHGPMGSEGLSDGDWDVWREMEVLYDSGAAKTLGASNMTLRQLKELVEGARVKPKYLQNRCYARTEWDQEVRAFCAEADIRYQGFSLLTANRFELKTAPVHALASKMSLTVPQLVFVFAKQSGIWPLTGTSDEDHMKEDLAVSDRSLTTEDFKMMSHIGLPK